jgi:hypothetical protein
MTPQQSAFIVPISVVCIIFASFYVNIRMAKKMVWHWSGYTTYMFLRSCGLGGVKTRAKSFWMKEMRYAEAEAFIISKRQSRAMFFAAIGTFIVMAIASDVVRR